MCLQIRYKKEWRPSQWSSYDPYANEYIGCRDCHDSGCGSTRESLNDLLSQLLALRPPPLGRQRFLSFVEVWVEGVPFQTRKDLSHFGALACRDKLDPVHWIDKNTGKHYFDPTNDIYMLALQFVIGPTVVSWLNKRSAGDVIESLLGICFLKGSTPWKEQSAQQQIRVAGWLEDVSYLVYRINRGHPGKLQALLQQGWEE